VKLGPKTHALYDIIPPTYILPKDYCAFSERFYEDMNNEGEYNIWIMKPIGKSRGRGITLVNDIR
jgi:tubulin polyglutamylase TTLL5